MKILCTADWHIGKRLEAYSRLEEQKIILNHIIETAENESADVVIISGDCFDTQNPSAEMARLFVATLARLSQGGERLVLVIAGNHDNPVFLSSSEALASYVGVCIVSYPNQIPHLEPSTNAWKVENTDEGMIEIFFKKYKKKVRFLLSPFANAYRLKKDLGHENEDLKAWEILCKQWEKNISSDPEVVTILATHYFCVPEKQNVMFESEDPKEDEGERPIVGSVGAMSLSTIPEGIDFMVLGHIHRPQELFSYKTKAFYTGSPLPYSLAESGQKKKLAMIELSRKNTLKWIDLPLLRDVKEIVFSDFKVIYDELERNKEHYLVLVWEGDRYMDPEEQRALRQKHNYILRIESRPKLENSNVVYSSEMIAKQSTEEIFQEYFQQKKSVPAPENILEIFRECLADEKIDENLERKKGFLPKRLLIRGFYSYKEEVEINFSSLEIYRFFGVFGQTGSGKSALIEAMIFSLYDRIERTKGSSHNFSEAYALLNLESNELYIEFEFEIYGINGKEEYQCRVRGLRNKKKPLEIPLKREVFQKENNEWISIGSKILGDELLGIDYKDFQQTIILQQRDFMNFLSAGPKETTETLKRLFQLDRFDLEDSLKKISFKNHEKVKDYVSRLSEYQSINSESITEWSEELAKNKDLIPLLEKEINKIHLERDSLQKMQDQMMRLHTVSQILEEKKQQLPTFEQAKERYKYQVLFEWEEELANIVYEIKRLQQDLEKSSEEITVNIKIHEEKLLKEEELNQKITALQEEEEKIEQKNLALQNAGLSEKINELKLKILKMETLISEQKKLKIQLDDLNLTTKELPNLEQKLLEISEKDRQQKDQNSALLVAHLLVEGCACPVCGSLEHPHPVQNLDEMVDYSDQLKEINRKIIIFKQNQEQIKTLEKELQSVNSSMESLEKYELLKSELIKLSNDEQELNKQKTELVSTKQNLKNSLRDYSTSFQKILQERQSFAQSLVRLEEKEKFLKTIINEKQDIYKHKKNLWIEKGAELGFTKEKKEEVQYFPIIPEGEIEEFFDEYKKMEHELQILTELLPRENIESHSLNQELNQLEQKFSELSSELQQIQQRIGALDQQIQKRMYDLKIKTDYETDLKKYSLRQDLIGELEKLLKARAFVFYVAQKYLHRLCHSANHRFLAFTRNQFELVAPKSSDDKKGKILVLDRLAGGQKRDLMTLSGGQSFQAALALSLALADESGAGHRFFFIDEGFGSLDQESLILVLQTLRKLSDEEERIVGIISHVQQMKEEVQAYWSVARTDKGTDLDFIIN